LLIRYAVVTALVVIVVSVYVLLASHTQEKLTKPGEPIQGITQSLARNIPADYPRVVFTDVTESAGIKFKHFCGVRSSSLPEDMGSGAAWGDYDNDGDLDLYVVNFCGPIARQSPCSDCQGNALYQNNGDGTFTDVAEKAGVNLKAFGMGAAWGDYDNDGDLDLYVTNYGPNVLFRNNGNGTFTDVTAPARVGDPRFSAGATWGDYNNDGYLDLYVCNYVDFRSDELDRSKTTLQFGLAVPFTLNPSSYNPLPNALYRNNRDGTFTDVARQIGVDNPDGRSLSASFCDFDGDGWPDLYVANDVSKNAMYRNLGNGRFADISATSWAADYRGAMGLAIGDYDNDGDMDMFITHWIAQENALYENFLDQFKGRDPNPLKFGDVADLEGLGEIALDFVGWGTDFFDYDNDGKLDLFVVNGHTFQDQESPERLIPQRNLLFWNKGREGFFEVGAVSGPALGQKHVGRGAAFADYDGDGDVDIFVVVHGGRPILLRNDGGNRNHWLKIRLKGSGKNRFGVGAQLKVTVSGQTQIREVGASSSYLSQNSLEVEFGFGRASTVDKLEIGWPSRQRQTLKDVKTDQTVVVAEP